MGGGSTVSAKKGLKKIISQPPAGIRLWFISDFFTNLLLLGEFRYSCDLCSHVLLI